MGQKVHPTGLRLGYNKPWRSRWFAAADYAKLLHEDLKLKKDLKARFQHAGVAKRERILLRRRGYALEGTQVAGRPVRRRT